MKNKIISNMLKLLFVGALSVSLATTVAVPATVQAEEMGEVVVAEDTEVDAAVEEAAPAEEADDEIPADMATDYGTKVGNYYYKIKDGSAYITRYVGNEAEITIPTNLDGNDISMVGSNAFEGNMTLKKLIIPEKIKTLSKSAFKNCTALEEIIIRSNLAAGDSDSASKNWSNSSSIFWHAGSTDGMKVVFEGNVDTIPAYLFATGNDRDDGKYASVTEIVINAPVKTIGKCAFYRCYSLKSVKFNDVLNSIGNHAFCEAVSLTSLDFPDSLTEIGASAFYGNSSLTELLIKSNIGKVGNDCFANCSELVNVTIDGSTEFSGFAFDKDAKIKKAVINGNAILGKCAFRNCTGLSELIINADVAAGDSDSKSANWTESSSTFWSVGKTSNDLKVTFGEGVTKIPAYLFATGKGKSDNNYCYVKEVVLPNSLTGIEKYAFFRCFDLKKVTFGNKITTIGDSAFEDCSALDTTVVPDNAELIVPESVTTISKYAFYNTAFSSIKTSKSLRTVGDGAFEGCLNNESLIIDGSTTFSKEAFLGNTKLKTVTINRNAKLGRTAFSMCTALEKLIIKGNLAAGEGDSRSKNWTDSASIFYDTGRLSSKFEVIFEEGVTVIPDYLFATGKEQSEQVYCRISSVKIPVSVKSIGKYAFYNCFDLKNISYGGSEARFKQLLTNEKGETVEGNEILLNKEVVKTYDGKKYNAKDWADPTDDPSEEPTKPENPENPETPGAGDGETIAINESNNLVIKQKVDITQYLPTEKFSVSVSPKGVGAVSKKKVDGVTRYFFTAKKVCDVPIEITAYKKVGGKKETIKKITLQEKIVKPVVNKSFVKLKTGDTISANEIFSENTPKITSWSSSNPLIADVDQTTGTISITANEKAGSAKIYAYIGNVKYTISVKAKIPMLSKVSMKVGGMKKIKIKNLSSAPSAYRSENDKVATVSSDGYVTGLSIGSTRVWATIDGVEYPCLVTVKP